MPGQVQNHGLALKSWTEKLYIQAAQLRTKSTQHLYSLWDDQRPSRLILWGMRLSFLFSAFGIQRGTTSADIRDGASA